MAKDPAFLFYSSDFLVGTYAMTPSQVGYYIRLLCLQHTKGHLSKDFMTSVMDGKFNEAVACKFQVDESGLYYNARLDKEASRRKGYSESRSKNRMSKDTITHDEDTKTHDEDMSNICEQYVPHMETETITITKVPKKPKKGVKGETKHKYGMYSNVLLTDDDLAKLKAEFPDWAARIEKLSEGIEIKGYVYKNHLATIRAWARKDKEDGRSGQLAKPGAGGDESEKLHSRFNGTVV